MVIQQLLLDTPGFRDSRGMNYDGKIIEMIRDLFKNWIDSVNGICFFASASSARLTSTQKYIFSSIVSLFGNDISENFIPMLTFCDGKEPQILASFDDESTFKKSIYDNIKDNNPWIYNLTIQLFLEEIEQENLLSYFGN